MDVHTYTHIHRRPAVSQKCKVTCPPHHPGCVCVFVCLREMQTPWLHFSRHWSRREAGPPGSDQPVYPRQPPPLPLFSSRAIYTSLSPSPNRNTTPSPQMRREGSRDEGRGSHPGEARTRFPGCCFSPSSSLGVLLLRLRQAGVVSRLAQSVKPEPLKSEADGHGSPERSAVGVVGLG